VNLAKAAELAGGLADAWAVFVRNRTLSPCAFKVVVKTAQALGLMRALAAGHCASATLEAAAVRHMATLATFAIPATFRKNRSAIAAYGRTALRPARPAQARPIAVKTFAAFTALGASSGSHRPTSSTKASPAIRHVRSAVCTGGLRLSREAWATHRATGTDWVSAEFTDAVVARALRAQRIPETGAASAAPTSHYHHTDHTRSARAISNGQVKELLWPT
jgi:hypothetical protein